MANLFLNIFEGLALPVVPLHQEVLYFLDRTQNPYDHLSAIKEKKKEIFK